MNIKITLSVLLFAFSLLTPIMGQNKVPPCDISSGYFKSIVRNRIITFQDYLGIIGSKSVSRRIKERYIDNTLKIFINDGEGVFMEVSSLRRKNNISYEMPNYVRRLTGLKYAVVEITSADVSYVSDFYKVGDHWEATATIYQRFCGYKLVEGKKVPQYCDTTSKTIKVYVLPVEDLHGTYCMIKLGDISVNETTE